MKRILALLMATLMLFTLAACNNKPIDNDTPPESQPIDPPKDTITLDTWRKGICDAEGVVVDITEYDAKVDGQPMTQDPTQAIYRCHDMIFYEAGKGPTYGAGTEKDEHDKVQADFTVLKITKPGTYILSGFMSCGQILVDLGDNAKDDPTAVVNLYLNGVKIVNSAGPCILFQSVYECHTGEATQDVNTQNAGANVYICKDSVNILEGSYVAEIYNPDTVVVEDGKVVSAETLYEYDGAFYSKMSMNLNGDEGYLTLKAENEGICSEKHLTINGGIIYVTSGNDCINTNADDVSVTTINGGLLSLRCDGTTGEGDGVDSNGWVVINGGNIMAQSCATSGDSGIDADNGIHINGGTICATGNMMDAIGDGTQNYAVFQFVEKQPSAHYSLVQGDTLAAGVAVNNEFTYMLMSSPFMSEGEYKLTRDDEVLKVLKQDAIQMPGLDLNKPGMVPDVIVPGGPIKPPADMTPPPDVEIPPQPPEEDKTPTEEMTKPEHEHEQRPTLDIEDATDTVVITEGDNYFIVISQKDNP